MIAIQKMDFLIALYIFCIVVTELMGAKTFPLMHFGAFQLNASVAIFVLPLLFTMNDVIAEVHGRERARSIVQVGLIVVALIFLFSLLATSLPPSARFLATEPAYDKIFRFSMRISAASLIAFAAAELLDVWVFVSLRKRMQGKALWFRNNASNIVAQFADTSVFMVLAFYALDRSFIDNAAFLWSLILPYWLLKCAMSIIETPFVYAGVKWLRR